MTDPQLWLSALEIGAFFGLIALGYQLTLIGAGFFNFAIGPYGMVAALSTTWFVSHSGFPVLLAALIGLVLAVALSGLTELLVIRPVQKRAGLADLPALVAVTGVLFIIQQGAGLVFDRRSLPGQPLISMGPWNIAGVHVTGTAVLLIAVTALIFVVLTIWMDRSRSGRLLRAVGDNRDAASILGLPVNRIRMVAFFLSGAIAAIAGLLYAPKSGALYTVGLNWTLVGFLALVIGGIGRTWAPLVGGMLLGIVQVFAPYYFGNLGPTTVVLIVTLIFFALRPQGLFVAKVRS